MVCGGPWRGLECHMGHGTAVWANGWALAIPMCTVGGWLGGYYPCIPPSQYPARYTPLPGTTLPDHPYCSADSTKQAFLDHPRRS